MALQETAIDCKKAKCPILPCFAEGVGLPTAND